MSSRRGQLGKPAVAIVTESEYRELTRKRLDFKEFLINLAPSFESLELARDPLPMRFVEL